MWMKGVKPGSSARAASALKRWAISQALIFFLIFNVYLVGVGVACHITQMRARRQLVGVGSVFQPCGSCGSSSDGEACQKCLYPLSHLTVSPSPFLKVYEEGRGEGSGRKALCCATRRAWVGIPRMHTQLDMETQHHIAQLAWKLAMWQGVPTNSWYSCFCLPGTGIIGMCHCT